MTEAELRTLAEQIREELPGLIHEPDERAPVEVELASALARPPGEAGRFLVAALRMHPAVRDRLERDADRVAGRLPGDAVDPLGVLWVCPQCDYAVVLETVTDDDPLCPNDGSGLDRYQD